MKKLILAIFFIILITVNVQTSFGYTITFEDWGNRIEGIPIVCILEPTHENNKILTEDFVERFMQETQWAVGEWEVQLKTSERSRDKSMWDINQILIPFEEQKEFEYDTCNIFIHFKDKPELESDWYKVLGKTQYEQGDTGRTNIIIYYQAIDFCKTEDSKFYYYDPCYVDGHRVIQQLRSVTKHEFGHALGLGHYVADVMELNIQWAHGNAIPPSIMVVFTHQNTDDNIITPKDIEKVRSIYGAEGFLQDKTIENTFLSFESPQHDYILQEEEFKIIKINGLIDPKRVIVNVPVILEITKPDGTKDSEIIKVGSDGTFNIQKIIDSNVLNGTYSVIASYRNVISDEITFNVIKDETVYEHQEGPQIPQWVRDNAKGYGNGQLDDDNLLETYFLAGIEYLVEKGVLTTDLAEETKNQEYKIPDWVKNNAKWWTDNKISDEEFLNGMQYLIENQIIDIQF